MSAHDENGAQRLLREKELAFFGAVTAAASHDINNAVATIEQTAGILEDMALETPESAVIEKKRVVEIAGKIAKQTCRGADIVRRLRTFAHSVDDPESELDFRELLPAVAALSRRMADRKLVGLETAPSDSPIPARNSSFRTQQAVFFAIKEVLSASPARSTVALSAVNAGPEVRVSVSCREKDPEGRPEPEFLELLMRRLGGRAECSFDGPPSALLFFRARS